MSQNQLPSSITQSPFWILGATVRDDRQRISERADERSLDLDHHLVLKARSDLTNPRNRLSSELAWFPGVSPRRTEQLTSQISRDPLSLRSEPGLPVLAHANLLVAVFEHMGGSSINSADSAAFIHEIALLLDSVVVDDLRRDLNEDRTVSGFPAVMSNDTIQDELAVRRRHAKQTIRGALDRLPTEVLVSVMTVLADRATNSGQEHAPPLVDELIDTYEVEAHEFLEKEAANVGKLIAAARSAGAKRHRALPKVIEKIEEVSRNWDKVAQPIQVSAKARGIDHSPSHNLASQIRSLAVDLYNKHDLIAESKRLTNLLQDLFAEVPQMAERVEQDAEALDAISDDREDWKREITYQAEIGTVFKDTLGVSPDGLSWKRQTFPLATVTRVRWGAVRHSVNGIPTGTTYTIAFGDQLSEAVVTLRRSDVYSAFIERLWRAVGARLLSGLVDGLRGGQIVTFGAAKVSDDSIVLARHKWFGADESVKLAWRDTHYWSADGAFYVGAQKDKKVYVALSYIETPNVHVLERLITLAFKRGVLKLSQAFEDE